jgi:hypothetical protein
MVDKLGSGIFQKFQIEIFSKFWLIVSKSMDKQLSSFAGPENLIPQGIPLCKILNLIKC